MTLYEYYLIYPEGDVVEINHEIPTSSIINIYGEVLSKNLLNTNTLCYYVAKKQCKEERGIHQIFYTLEQLSLNQLCGEYL
ncbi:MAG: hypothetical protein ACTTKH_04975 [Treponema sp.]